VKKVAIFCDESLFGGVIRTGMAELCDSFANALASVVDKDGRSRFAVCVVCPDRPGPLQRLAQSVEMREGYRFGRVLRVDYYLIPEDDFVSRSASVLDLIEPDILHCFAFPEVLSQMAHRPSRTVYTIEQGDPVRNKVEDLRRYDAITTVSRQYYRELLEGEDALADFLSTANFLALPIGITTEVFSPAAGLRLPASYTSDKQGGKMLCKRRVLETYGIPGNPALYLMACRFVSCKGIEDVLGELGRIKASGGFVLFVGRGDSEYEKRLRALKRADGGLWVEKWASIAQVLPLLAAADFFLCPSKHETGGLMPLKACRYGAIPIAAQTGGLAENLDERVAVMIGDGGLSDALDRAANLYDDPMWLIAKRKASMEADFSWKNRIRGYVEIYGMEERP
jgi:glycosyltransferase involved in cell wall biosynthesis